MAQLRDTQTSHCIFEGTPTECVLLAEKIGRDEVQFDDVGLGFDPDAVLAAYKEHLDGFPTAERKHHRVTITKKAEAAATDELKDARARLEG